MKIRKYICLRLCLVLFMVLFWGTLTGCGKDGDNLKIVLTTGFAGDEVFRIEDISCRVPEMMVYLTNIQNRYESVYGSRIWETKIDDVTLEENVKETALAKMAQIKAMTLLAKKHNVTLSDEEVKLVETAADTYYTSLNQAEIDKMGVNQEVITKLYGEYALSNKLYHYLIKDINPEISDDEARTITVEHILIKTYNLSEGGEQEEYSEYAKLQAKNIATQVWEKAKSGEDFAALAAAYSDDDTLTYSFGKGEQEPQFEAAAFNLGTDEISDVIETKFGYHIIKCVSTFNREVTDQNKKKIVEERKKEVFGQEYEGFVASLTKNLNEKLWKEISFIHDEKVVTADFFEVYDRYFAESELN